MAFGVEGNSSGAVLIPPCPGSGNTLGKVQRPLEIGHGGQTSRARVNAPRHFLGTYVGQKGQEPVLTMCQLNEIAYARQST